MSPLPTILAALLLLIPGLGQSGPPIATPDLGRAGVEVRAADDRVHSGRIEATAILARAGLERLAPVFPGTPARPIRIFLHSSSASLHPVDRESLHEGVPGFARLQRDEIHIVLSELQTDPPNDLRTTVEHELVHILLDQCVGRQGLALPRWFHEGIAQSLAGGIYLGASEEDLVLRVRTGTYLRFHTLERRFPRTREDDLALAYAQSFSFVSFLCRTIGTDRLIEVARNCSSEEDFAVTFTRHVGQALVIFEDRWIDYVVNESGAAYRIILRNCFLLLTIVTVLPLLALGVARRRNREEVLKARLGREDDEEARAGAAGLLLGSDEDDQREGQGSNEGADLGEDGEWDEGEDGDRGSDPFAPHGKRW